MDIKYIAHSTFQIKTKSATIVTDPFANSIGIKLPKLAADIVTLSHSHADHSNSDAIELNPVVLDWPGEYEIKNTAVIGISTFHDASSGSERGPNVAFKIVSEGIQLLHLGDLGHKLSDAQIAQIGTVDVLLIPVGGVYTIDPALAAQVTKQIEPSIVIPMHFADPKLDQKTFGELHSDSEFMKLMGYPDVVSIPKLSIKSEDISAIQNTKVVKLDQSL